ncbi:MAG: SAM-dependent DNA methyltransferase [Alphaproteobacteria bacterium]|nr:SAM-dependent DNA methyltransferase [Alphaproteobacteria bacterium]
MAVKSNANIGFEKQIWGAACELWGHIPAADYRKVIVGLIFLRYISFAFEKRYQELVAEGDGFENDKDAYIEEGIFYVPKAARWSKIAAAAHTPEIGMVIDEAMRAIEAENKSLKNVLPKNYASQDLDKRVLGNVVDLFTNNIDMSETDKDKDLLGRTYEYCIAQFAAYEGTKGGEFYTPSSIVRTIVEVLKPFDNCRVYDPCCGSGGMFVQSVKFLQAHSGNRNRISVYGQESNADTWKMAKMNMAIRGIDANLGPYQADTFFNDLHQHEKFDFIMANPPFNLSNWGQDKLLDDVRWQYGIPPASNANYAWIQHMIHHLAPNGKIGLVLANGALSSTNSGEGDIRQKIIEADLVEGIIALPTQLFYSVTIPVTLWFISKNKQQKGRTVFIDARKMGYMVDRKHRDFTDTDIQKIADTFAAFQNGTLQNVKGFCAVATTEEIAKQDYILTPGRYVGIEEQADDGEPFEDKMKRLTSELSEMFKQSSTLQEEIKTKLKQIGWEVK